MKLSFAGLFGGRSVGEESLQLEFVELKVERLTAANVNSVRARIKDSFSGKKHVVLVCSELKFIDSSGLGLLVGLRNRMLAPQRLVLEGIADPVLLELFSLTRMDQVFRFSANRQTTAKIFDDGV